MCVSVHERERESVCVLCVYSVCFKRNDGCCCVGLFVFYLLKEADELNFDDVLVFITADKQ